MARAQSPYGFLIGMARIRCGSRRRDALGQGDRARLMFVVFTIRGRLIRVISARDMSRRERRIFRSS
jgi:uncharacterized DUF497 family protein